MDFFRRSIAPISTAAWEEIDSFAKDTIISNLSARKFVDINGPKGINFPGVNLGRIEIVKDSSKSSVKCGIHQVLPLIEARIMFRLGQWELDNIERGAKDTDLDPLSDACRQLAAFEENVVFNGYNQGKIEGLNTLKKNSSVDIKKNAESIIDGISEALTKLMIEGIDGPANLVVSEELWKYLARPVPGGSLKTAVERQTGGKVIHSPSVEGGLLISARGGDTELTIGQDYAIGYHSHSNDEISLYLTESFTFRVISPEAIVGLNFV